MGKKKNNPIGLGQKYISCDREYRGRYSDCFSMISTVLPHALYYSVYLCIYTLKLFPHNFSGKPGPFFSPCLEGKLRRVKDTWSINSRNKRQRRGNFRGF